MLKNKTVLKIVSLVIAIFLWIYVMGEVDPETKVKVYGIEVNYINTELLAENGLAVAEDEPVTINATIEGKRSDVNKAKKKGLTASVDVSRCKSGKNKAEITLDMPSGVVLDSISKDTADVDVEKIVWSEKPVEIKISGEDNDEANGEPVPWITGIDPGKITVYGAESLTEKVDRLVGKVPEKTATKSGSRTIVRLQPVDKDGNEVSGVTLNKKKAVVKTQLLTLADAKLSVDTTGLENGYTVTSVTCDDVSVVGTDDALEVLRQLNGTADLSRIKKEGTYTVKIDITELPEGIYLFKDSDIEGKVTVRKTE